VCAFVLLSDPLSNPPSVAVMHMVIELLMMVLLQVVVRIVSVELLLLLL
jgi:hypothetical protein